MYENLEEAFKESLPGSNEQKNAKLFLTILKEKENPVELQKLLDAHDSITLFYVGRFLGKFLGEVLYLRIFNEKKLLLQYDEIKERLFMSQASLDNFMAFTNLILPGDSYKDLRKRSF